MLRFNSPPDFFLTVAARKSGRANSSESRGHFDFPKVVYWLSTTDSMTACMLGSTFEKKS
jgi:hypothetical protein